MDITPLIAEHKKVIRRYGAGLFVVNDEEFHSTIALTDTQVLPCNITEFDSLTLDDITALLPKLGTVELLLIGSGATHKMLPPDYMMALQAHNITVESMSTGAACRTYNVLLSEERSVAALLFCL